MQGHHRLRQREHDLERVGVGEQEFLSGDAPVHPAPGGSRGQGNVVTLRMDMPVLRRHLHQQLAGRLTRSLTASVLDGGVFVVKDLPILGDRQGGASKIGPRGTPSHRNPPVGSVRSRGVLQQFPRGARGGVLEGLMRPTLIVVLMILRNSASW